MKISLKRLHQDQYGTHGIIVDDDALTGILCYTEELPWNDNKPDISCIPAGVYQCIKHNSSNHPDTWEITGVENRTNILIHSGNYLKDTLGCVLVGLKPMTAGVLESVLALERLRVILPDTFEIQIFATPNL